MGFVKKIAEFLMPVTWGGGKEQQMPAQAAMPSTPTQEDALLKAQKDADKRRKIQLLSGGKTTQTSGQGAELGQGQMARKNLLGQ